MRKFAIPLKREDLAHAPEDASEYYVREVFSVRELKTKLKVSLDRIDPVRHH
jgi:hypothetical protein